MKERAALLSDLEMLDVEHARDDLLEFILEMRTDDDGICDYEVNFHHEAICDRLTRLRWEQGQRIIITVPPQYGKSEIVSRYFPAWIMGHNPKAKIILSSYSAELASGFNRDAQAIMETAKYREIFSKTKIYPIAPKRPRLKRTDNFCETSARGYLFTVGVGGSTTGRTANPLFIVDDPIKDLTEAMSPTRRQKVLEWFKAVATTRLSLNANVVVMHTRWHDEDLAGHLIDQMEQSEIATQWEVINFPAVAAEGIELHEDDPREPGSDEPLWPKVKGDRDVMRRIRHDVGDFIWSSLYQGGPKTEGGNIFDSRWWRYYQWLPDKFQETVISLDAAFEDFDTSDYVVFTVWGRDNTEKYLIDVVRGHFDVIKTAETLVLLTLKYPNARAKLIEKKANGPAIIQHLKGKVSGLIPWEPEGSKVSRAYAVAPQIQAGNVLLPDPSIAKFDLTSYLREMSAFPVGKHDDQVDSTTQALEHLSRNEHNYLRQLLKKGPSNAESQKLPG